jgi:hypothetical protein
MKSCSLSIFLACLLTSASVHAADPADSGFHIENVEDRVLVTGEALDFAAKTKGYCTGIAGGSLLDKKSGFHDQGFGLDIIDWLMEPGSDEAYRDQLPGDLAYVFNNPFHGKRAKKSIEGPQICTHANATNPVLIGGKDYLVMKQSWQYTLAAPNKNTGSVWNQTMVFPRGKRYFLSADKMTVKNASDSLFFRQDMPGHIKHKNGDTFSEVYLSYLGRIPASEFSEDFAPDERFNYRRDINGAPERFIRAYHLRDPKTGNDGPWLAGMTLNPSDVSEAWCHERKYVCLIEEIGERPIQAGQSFGAAYVVGYFDSIDEMNAVYDQYKGHSGLVADENAWRLTEKSE